MNKSKQSNSKKVWVALLCGLAAVAIVVLFAYFIIPKTIFSGLTNFYMPNYATETVKPIDHALTKAGAVKVCQNAANGRDPGNMQPSYAANYQFDKSNEETVQILRRIASENGYSLAPVPSNYESIDHYEDRTSKAASYSDLTAGKVMLNFSTYSDTSSEELTCPNGERLLGDASHTGVSLSLALPPFKH